jgi:hypothetical protein
MRKVLRTVSRYLNAGFFFTTSTPQSFQVIEEMQLIMKDDRNVPDQDALNVVLLRLFLCLLDYIFIAKLPRVPEVRMRVLEKEQFANGFVDFLQASPSRRCEFS